MNKLKTVYKMIKQPFRIVIYFNSKGIRVLSDKKYLEMIYENKFGKKLDLSDPRLFNEKLQWLKLYDRKEIYTVMVDKYEVKKYITDRISDQYIIPTLGIYDKFDEIDFDELPNQFVIKCTHDSGGLVICKDKTKLDIEATKKIINKCLRKNFYYLGREWPYKNVKPRIIIEKYMKNKEDAELRDYKFFCFNGKIGIVLVCTNRQKDLEETWLDEDFNLIDLREGGHRNRNDLIKPRCFNEMKKIAKKLSEGLPHIRVDLYEIGGKVYFGELTLYPASGFEMFDDKKWDKKLGDLIDLRLVKNDG